jgi:hypothetical protein
MSALRARFIAPGDATPARALGVDGLVKGAALTLSHWQGAPPPPPGLDGDTSTAMLLAAAADPARPCAGLEWACNDHVDADGLIAVAVACRPQLVRARELLVGAAEAGDFLAYPGEPAYRLMLRLHQYIRSCRVRGQGWEQAAYGGIAAAMPALIAESATRDPERDAQVGLVEETRRRLRHGDGFAIERTPGLLTISWRARGGQLGDPFNAVAQDEDLPLHAIDAIAGPADYQLIAMGGADGTVYRLDAPRHSWARTVVRPQTAWPELGALRALLQDEEGADGCRWLARPAAGALNFTCLLGSARADGAGAATPAASRLSYALVRSACAQALAARP